jgi:N-acetyl sugar amidotransferase
LKFDFGLNPLLVTVSPLLPNDVGTQNREAMVRLGFDHLFFRPNQRVHRHLARRFFVERGNPKIAWDAAIHTIPIQVAVQYGIPLVFYAEHGESEYGGRVLHADSNKYKDFTEVIEHHIGDDPRNWLDEVVTENDLNPYVYPDIEAVRRLQVRAYYFSYFFRWSMRRNYELIRTKIPFATHPKGRTPGTFTDFDSLDDKFDDLYYYMQYVKFGFGRALRDACRMVQNEQMTREQALDLAHRYDGEFPADHLDEVLDYMQMTRTEFDEIVDRHRNQELWERAGGEWKLRYPAV